MHLCFSVGTAEKEPLLRLASGQWVIRMVRRTTEREPSQDFVGLWHYFVFLESQRYFTLPQHVPSDTSRRLYQNVLNDSLNQVCSKMARQCDAPQELI